jgi:hypothetical protein
MPCRPGTPITQLRGTGRLLEPHRLVNDVGSPCARQAAGPVAGVSEPQLDGLGR